MQNLSDFEQLGYFYLGKRVEAGDLTEDLVLLRANDLTTHAAIVGMTGSGKTGLGVALIEEALLDGIPVIAIDPKGDLGNLLLTFPDFRAEAFRPWVSASEAAVKGVTVDEYAQQQADLWRKGLADWGQTPERVRALEASAERRIFTPGSTAGISLSMLSSFDAPVGSVASDPELLGERIEAAVSGLLTLLDIEPDPVSSREHVLLANIFEHTWKEGQDLTLEALLSAIQDPPFERVGLLGLEAFFPREDRFRLTVRLNQLVAAPGFETWLQGEPLDAERLFYTPEGRPRLSVITISHLSDAERMFAVTSVLNEVISWMRSQTGTSALRAMLYMDEVFGFLPPVANPPSKKLFLTLLKQARAFGLSTVLATQNPVDLDYKALSNAGTWFVGRLQTKRDRARLLDGMKTLGGDGDVGDLSDTISALGKRQFVVHSVHSRERLVMGTRWVMSYLAGPMTRDQIRALRPTMEGAESGPASAAARTARGEAGAKPILPPAIAEYSRGDPVSDPGPTTYEAVLFGRVRLLIADAKAGVREERLLHFELEAPAAGSDPGWERATLADASDVDIATSAREDARFVVPAAELQSEGNYRPWSQALKGYVERTQTIDLFKSPRLGLTSEPRETEASFRIRARQRAREERDEELDAVRKKFESRMRTLENRLQRATHALERESQQADQAKMNTTIAVGQTILGALFGRRGTSVSRAGTAARSASRIAKEAADVERAQEKVDRVDEELRELREDMEHALEDIRTRFDEEEAFEVHTIRPRSSDVDVELIGVMWRPVG